MTDEVHAKGSYIFCQLWVVGRRNVPELLDAHGPPYPYISAGDVQAPDRSRPPRALTKEEIKEYIQDYVSVSRAAVEQAGFDGIQINARLSYGRVPQELCEQSYR